MSEPLAHTDESRAAAELDALKRELAGAKQRQAASVDLDDVEKTRAANYVKDVSDEIARVTKGKPATTPAS